MRACSEMPEHASQIEKLKRQVEWLQDRLSKLSKASLRTNESLDVNIVLREVVESACALTGARRGGITTLDDDGQWQEFVGSGFTYEEYEQLTSLPDGQQIFEYLSGMQEPFRTPDLSVHIRAQGFLSGPLLMNSFLGMPVRYRDTQVAHFYLGEKDGGLEFSDDDQEVLAIFASQAATAIANARQHRDERRARADLETLLDTSPVGVVVFDVRNWKVESLNQEARRIVGGMRGYGRSLTDILKVMSFRRVDGREIAHEDLPPFQVMSTGEAVRAEEMIVQSPDGGAVPIVVNATPILSECGEVESVVATMQDMTPLEEMARLRTEFLGMVSHELRMPLTTIKGAATTALDEFSSLGDAETRQYLKIIEEQTRHMRGLIGDLLDVTRIEAGIFSVSPEPVDVASLLESARNAFVRGTPDRHVEVDLGPDMPEIVADKTRIVQVLSNLLSNASRHSPNWSAIKVVAWREDVYVAFSVSDEGSGISSEQLPNIFRKFSRFDTDNMDRNVRGAGLGLAICKGIVEVHGGRIWVESEGVGLGARFTFTIPAVQEAAARAPQKHGVLSDAQEWPDTERKRILAVDDDPQIIRYVRRTLSKAGFAPMATTDPEEVERLVRAKNPSLILLDLKLPGYDGIELMKRVRKIADVPVIFLSAHGGDAIIERVLNAGADDYTVKPFSPIELVARINAVLRRWSASEHAEAREPYLFADLNINYAERRVTLDGRTTPMTATEYKLLVELSSNGGRALTHDHLLRRVWGPEYVGQSSLVRSFVRNIRYKLGDDARTPKYIFTEPGVGYLMQKPSGSSTLEPHPTPCVEGPQY